MHKMTFQNRIGKTILMMGVLLWSFSMSFAQAPGFHGKLLSTSVGLSLNSGYLGYSGSAQITESRDFSMLPPKTSFALEYALTQRLTAEVQASFFAIPNTRFYVTNYQSGDNIESLIVDTVKLKSNMLSLSTGFRRYTEFTHYGKYVAVGAAGNYFNTIIYPTVYRQVTTNGIVEKHEYENLETGRQWTYNFSLYFGLGKKHIFPNYVTMDYGLNMWVFLGKDKNFVIGDDYRNDLRHVVDHLMLKRAQETHIFEFYMKFGLLK